VNRWLALLIAVVASAAVAWAATLFAAGAIGGILWIFVYGDNEWPAWTNVGGGIAAFLVGLAVWIIVGMAIWRRLTPRS
jgi:hypothetical protein